MIMLPRPKADHYRGGMPLGAEQWLIDIAEDVLGVKIDRSKSGDILNVFSGMNRYGTRVDLNPEVKPDYLGDIHELSKILPAGYLKKFLIIFADPAYSDEENEQLFGHKMHIDYKKWTSECSKFLKPGGLLIVYHKFLPANPDKTKYVVVKRVGVANRPGHLVRIAVYFQSKVVA
jgi:hypothetical protein